MDFRFVYRHAPAGVGRKTAMILFVTRAVSVLMIVTADMGVAAICTCLWFKRGH